MKSPASQEEEEEEEETKQNWMLGLTSKNQIA